MMHFLDEDRNGLLSWVELEVCVDCTFCVHTYLHPADVYVQTCMCKVHKTHKFLAHSIMQIYWCSTRCNVALCASLC